MCQVAKAFQCADVKLEQGKVFRQELLTTGWFRKVVGPWIVHPSRVWVATGVPGGPRWTGLMGVIKCGWSDPMSTIGWMLLNVFNGIPFKCWYFCCRTSAGHNCLARFNSLAEKACRIWNLTLGLAMADTSKDTVIPWSWTMSCLIVLSVSVSLVPFSPRCFKAASKWLSVLSHRLIQQRY